MRFKIKKININKFNKLKMDFIKCLLKYLLRKMGIKWINYRQTYQLWLIDQEGVVKALFSIKILIYDEFADKNEIY
jgi:hypothetical protein